MSLLGCYETSLSRLHRSTFSSAGCGVHKCRHRLSYVFGRQETSGQEKNFHENCVVYVRAKCGGARRLTVCQHASLGLSNPKLRRIPAASGCIQRCSASGKLSLDWPKKPATDRRTTEWFSQFHQQTGGRAQARDGPSSRFP